MHSTKAVEKIKPEKIQASKASKPMTALIPVQCSYNLAIKPTGSWPICEFANNIIIDVKLIYEISYILTAEFLFCIYSLHIFSI